MKIFSATVTGLTNKVELFDNGTGFSEVVRPGRPQPHFTPGGRLCAMTYRGHTSVLTGVDECHVQGIVDKPDWVPAIVFGGMVVALCVATVAIGLIS